MHILTKLELSRSSDCDADTMEASLFVMDSRCSVQPETVADSIALYYY